jgi:hypothetical protein
MLEGIDFVKFRLFHLSILWRASLSLMFPELMLGLGPRPRECLRQMLWAGYADCLPGYTFTATCLTYEGNIFHAISDGQELPPARGGARRFAMVYAGCAWIFYVSDRITPDIRPWVLHRNGTMALEVQDVGTYFGVSPTWRRRRRPTT